MARPSIGGRATRAKGSLVRRMKRRNAEAIQPCTARVEARSTIGMPEPNPATSPPNSARISTQSSMEPSWLPQTLAIL